MVYVFNLINIVFYLLSVEINDYVEAYKSEFNLDTNPYAIDVINHYKDIKDMFTLTLDTIMNKLNLLDNHKSSNKNIFDILAEEINNQQIRHHKMSYFYLQ